MSPAGWLHCFSGISGDMALGACLDAGAPLDEIRALLARLPVEGWSLRAEPVLRGGLAATLAVVEVEDDGSTTRTAADLVRLVEAAALPPRVQRRAVGVVERLGRVEGRLHGTPAASTVLHELGGLDTVIDVVGTCAALEVLGIDRLFASPVVVGLGTVRGAHGLLPNPAPAVVDLLVGVEVRGLDVAAELTTPTGAALLAGLCEAFGPLPAMRLTAGGFGAGSRELDGRPNVAHLVVGDLAEAGGGAGAGEPLVVLEANLDDATGEVVAYAVESLLLAGALDAWTVPVGMKKGRPGTVVSALCRPVDASALAGVMRRETGSLGVRATAVERFAASREADEVELLGRAVRVKRTAGRVKVEYDDAARLARETGLPLREVLERGAVAAQGTGRRGSRSRVAIRQARPEDYPAIGALTVAAYEALPTSPGEDYMAELADVAGRVESGAVVLVAEEPEGTITGSVTLLLDPGPYFEHEYGVDGDCGFRMLAVSPSAWGRGVGSALVEECIRRCVAAGRARLVIASVPWMTTAHRLYWRLGFERRPDLDQWWGETHGMAFVRPLP